MSDKPKARGCVQFTIELLYDPDIQTATELHDTLNRDARACIANAFDNVRVGEFHLSRETVNRHNDSLVSRYEKDKNYWVKRGT